MMFKQFLMALNFLTTIPSPIGAGQDFSPKKMRGYFPVVGLFIGLILALLDYILGNFFSPLANSWIEVVALICITGGLHLDGLGDSADGLLSHRSRERALEIMKDSRIGVMGVLAIIIVLGTKWMGISEIHSHRLFFLCIIPAYSRTSMLIGMKYLDYCRERGTAKGFFNDPIQGKDFIFFFVLIGISCIIPLAAVFINLGFLFISFLIITFYKDKLGCITGDTLGAMCEIVEAFLFLCAGLIY